MLLEETATQELFFHLQGKYHKNQQLKIEYPSVSKNMADQLKKGILN